MKDSRFWLALALSLFVFELWLISAGKPWETVVLVSIKFSVCLAAAGILNKLEEKDE